MRARMTFLGRESLTTLALRFAKPEPQEVFGPIPASGWKPALETKMALKGTALIRALSLTVARLRTSTTP
jgi:hypothetical protein